MAEKEIQTLISIFNEVGIDVTYKPDAPILDPKKGTNGMVNSSATVKVSENGDVEITKKHWSQTYFGNQLDSTTTTFIPSESDSTTTTTTYPNSTDKVVVKEAKPK